MADSSPRRSCLKRFQVPIDRFARTALPLYLELIDEHHKNIKKYQNGGQWDKARAETLNAQRTAVQLKAAVEEMECVRDQLSASELAEFNKRFAPYKSQALAALNKVTLLNPRLDEHHPPENEECDKIQTQQPETEQKFSDEEIALEQRKVQLETYGNLHTDIVELHQLISHFAEQVQEQGSSVNQIEEHVETAADNISAGEQFLAKTAKIKAAVYPLTGALIGGCLGGPVGLVAGLKIGGLAAVGGTVLGFTSGHAVKKFYEKKPSNSEEPKQLQRSSSLELGDRVSLPEGMTKTSSMKL